jgi:lipoprotein-anchoring transpeptidase ErfK/SrfK
MRTPSLTASSAALLLIWASGTLPGAAAVYKENIDVPVQTTPARQGLFFRPAPGFNSPIPSERYAASREGKAHLKRTTQKYPNSNARIITYRVPEVMNRSNSRNTELVIDIGRQRAFLLINGHIGLETPVSTARSGKYTPTGSFVMTERIRSGKISSLYDVEMPFWMRLNDSEFGVHAGFLPGYPASAGCIRLPADAAQAIFNETRSGTRVRIVGNWRPSLAAALPSPPASPAAPQRPAPLQPARNNQARPTSTPVDSLGQTFSRVQI